MMMDLFAGAAPIPDTALLLMPLHAWIAAHGLRLMAFTSLPSTMISTCTAGQVSLPACDRLGVIKVNVDPACSCTSCTE